MSFVIGQDACGNSLCNDLLFEEIADRFLHRHHAVFLARLDHASQEESTLATNDILGGVRYHEGFTGDALLTVDGGDQFLMNDALE